MSSSKKQQILDAALQLFVAQGVPATPTSQISKSAGVATGTLFHHFKNKDELVTELVLAVKTELAQRVQAQLHDTSDYSQAIRSLWTAYIAWAIQNPLGFEFKNQIESLSQYDEALQAKLNALFAPFFHLVQRGMDEHHFKTLPHDYLASIIDSQVITAARYFIEHPQHFEQAAITEVMFQSFWDCLRA